MKQAAFLLLFCLGAAIHSDAQTSAKRNRIKVRTQTTHPAKSKGKSEDANTTGVMGKDTVRLSKKGMGQNMNANTGVALPPSSGGN